MKTKLLLTTLICAGLIVSGCSNMSNRQQRMLSGAAIGTVAGAAIGGAAGNVGTGAAIGAAGGAVVGATIDD